MADQDHCNGLRDRSRGVNTSICGVVFALTFLAQPGAVLAGKDFSYGKFAAEIAWLQDHILETCQDNGGAFLDQTGVYGPLSDQDNLRHACGQGLTDRPIDYTPYFYFYFQEEGATGRMDVLGVRKPLSFKDRSYELVLGLMTRIGRPHNAPETREAFATVTLFESHSDTHRPVWVYVDPTQKDWNRPSGYVFDPSGNIDPDFLTWLEDVWLKEINFRLGQLTHSLRDRRP